MCEMTFLWINLSTSWEKVESFIKNYNSTTFEIWFNSSFNDLQIKWERQSLRQCIRLKPLVFGFIHQASQWLWSSETVLTLQGLAGWTALRYSWRGRSWAAGCQSRAALLDKALRAGAGGGLKLFNNDMICGERGGKEKRWIWNEVQLCRSTSLRWRNANQK